MVFYGVCAYVYVCIMCVQGGAIAALTVIQRPELFTGVVFTAPAIISDVNFFRVSFHSNLQLGCVRIRLASLMNFTM